MRNVTSHSWSGLVPIAPKSARLNPVVVHEPTFDNAVPVRREKPRVLETVRWKCFNWNTALGLGTVALVSAAGWAGIALLVSTLLEH